GQKQTAYQVLVARSRAELDANQRTLWDSGKVQSDQSVAVEYNGQALGSGTVNFWKVMLWDKDGAPTAWSQPARFVMGKLQPSDWKGQWIGASEDPNHAAVYLRKEIEVSKPVRRATAFFSGLGWSELYIDGKKASDWVLSPGNTCYHVRAPYLALDVTDRFAAPGRKAIGVILGDGWYALEKDPWVHRFEKLPYVDKPKLLLDIELEFTDGSTQVLGSDGSWKWSFGPITKNWVAIEHIDLRKSMPGWDRPGYADSAWQPAAPVKGPAGKLVCQKEPPTRVIETIKPQRLSQNARTGGWVYEFGREFQGWVQFRTSGPAGTEVTIIVRPHGYSNHFILAGEGVEQYVPRFNYNAISSIEIKGTTQPPTLDDLVGCQVNADLQTAGVFRSSDDVLNWLHGAVIRTFMNYVTGIPNDPTREKKGWTQDVETEFRSAAYLFDSQSLFERWQWDIIDGQSRDGNCPNVTPGPFFDAFNSTWWGGMVVWGPWQWYQVYGDRRILADSYPAMKKYVDFLTKTGKDHMQDWGLTDWLAIEDSPRMLVNTPAYYLYAQIVSQAAAMQGNHEDAKTYADLAQTIKRKFNEKFLYAKTGVYGISSAKPAAGVGGAAGNSKLAHRIWWEPGEPVCTQGAQTMALATGLVPDDSRKAAQESLLKEIAAHDGYLSTGFVSTMYMLDILSDLAPQIGQAMVDKTSAPSWYAMTAGTNNDLLKETWSGGAALMPPLGCTVAFWNFYSLGGIRSDPSGPGFKKIVIRPNMVGDLHWVQCHYDSVHGRIESNWSRRGDTFVMDVTVPANTTATVHVPAGIGDITESGVPAAQAAGVRLLGKEGDRTVFETAAGVYRFVGRLQQAK
ncbi:MAG: family 78 glycoside hydrolase catalytic domain, partial [Thermoguttaceae bacterium]